MFSVVHNGQVQVKEPEKRFQMMKCLLQEFFAMTDNTCCLSSFREKTTSKVRIIASFDIKEYPEESKACSGEVIMPHLQKI